MKTTHKITVATLIAASILSVPAFAWNIDTSTGLPTGTITSGTHTNNAAETVSTDTAYTLTADNDEGSFALSNGSIKLTSDSSKEASIAFTTSGSGDVWFAEGRWYNGTTGLENLANTGTNFITGQICLGEGTISKNLSLGTGTWTENVSELKDAVFRVQGNVNLSGTTTVLAGGSKIALDTSSGSRTFTVSKLAGSGDLAFTNYKGSASNAGSVKIGDTSSYTGSVSFAGTYSTIEKTGAGNLTVTHDESTTPSRDGSKVIISAGSLTVGHIYALAGSDVFIRKGAQLKLGTAAADTTAGITGNLTLFVSDDNIATNTKTSTSVLISNEGTTSKSNYNYFWISGNDTIYIDISDVSSLATATVDADTTDVTTSAVELTIASASALTLGTGDYFKVGTWNSGLSVFTESTQWKAGTFNSKTGTLTLVAVPEPSAFGLLAGIGALALAISRRRRSRR